jgi:hypothetical protein
MANTNTTSMQVELKILREWACDLLDEMAQGPVEIKRRQAQYLRREIFGAAGSRKVPKRRGRMVFRLPNSDDVLVLDYAEPAPRFQPSWVSGRVYRGAVRVVLPPTASPWVQSILRPFQRRAAA